MRTFVPSDDAWLGRGRMLDRGVLMGCTVSTVISYPGTHTKSGNNEIDSLLWIAVDVLCVTFGPGVRV